MKKMVTNAKMIFKISLVLLTLFFILIFMLIYFDKSPFGLIIMIKEKIKNDSIVFDNTNLYSFTEPVDSKETIDSMLNILKGTTSTPNSGPNLGMNLTEQFYNYVKLSGDFINLSKMVTTWDNYFLAFDNSKLFLFQIIKDQIYLKTLSVPDVKRIEFAYIFRNGNILFCDNKQAYYSHDKLVSYHKSKILDYSGIEYSADEYGNFFNLVIDGRQVVDDKELRVWGNYSNYGIWQPGVERSQQIQIWYTKDDGKTIKSAYKFGFSEPKLICRHIHSVNMCPWDNSFWVQTGDGPNECHWIQGKYDWEKDYWSWTLRASGDEMSNFKSTGFVFYDYYVYWSDDSSDPKKYGIWRTPYSNLISSSLEVNLFEKVLTINKEIGWFIGDDKGFMLASQYFSSPDSKYKIFFTYDGGVKWHSRNTAFQVVNITPPNSFGYILGNYFINQETFEAVHYWDWTPSIFVNPYIVRKN